MITFVIQIMEMWRNECQVNISSKLLARESVEWDCDCLLATMWKTLFTLFRQQFVGNNSCPNPLNSSACSWYEYNPLCFSWGYLRVAEEEQAEDRIGSEEVNEGAAQAPARQR